MSDQRRDVMNPGEYHRMASVERDHWWFIGVRDMIDRTLAKPRWRLPEQPYILDAGCGTGGNLRHLIDRYRPAYAGGFDMSPLAIDYSRKQNPDADIYPGDLREPEIHVDHLDLIISCEVIYIPGGDAAVPGLRRMAERLRPGGLMILHLPAYNWLFSEQDIAMSTSERFTCRRVRRLINDVGLKVELLTYRMFTLFPAVVLKRLPSILGSNPPTEEAVSDIDLPGNTVNTVLRRVVQAENATIAAGMRYPWGSSVYVVGRKA